MEDSKELTARLVFGATVSVKRDKVWVEIDTGSSEPVRFTLTPALASVLSVDLSQCVEQARTPEKAGKQIVCAPKVKVEEVGLDGLSGQVFLSLVDQTGAKAKYLIDPTEAVELGIMLLQNLTQSDKQPSH